MPLDLGSLPLTTNQAASKAALNQAAREYLGWHGDPVATLNGAAEKDEGFAFGHVLNGVLRLLSGETEKASPGLAACRAAIEKAKPTMSGWERAHVAAFEAWHAGDIRGAAAIWEQILIHQPHDIWALRFAHDTYFYLGDAANLRDSPARVLPAWGDGDDLTGFIKSMHAFGLEECGDYRGAEAAARAAIAVNPADTWGVHALAHVMEMEGRQQEGIAFLNDMQPHWQQAPALAVHQWWHLSLFLIERGRLDEVLEIYDQHVRGTPSAALLDLVDAAALLWRLQLAGIDVGDRWQGLREHWYAHLETHMLVFNDAHIAMVAGGLKDRSACSDSSTAPSPITSPRKREPTATSRSSWARRWCAPSPPLPRAIMQAHVDLLLPVRYDDLAHRRQPRPARPVYPDADRSMPRRCSAGPWLARCWRSGWR